MEYKLSDLLKENEATKYIPQYIREYPKFLKLMLLFSNYIESANSTLEVILDKLNLSNATGDILEKIAKRCGISVVIPFKADGTIDTELYEERLKIAILCNGTKRRSASTRVELEKLSQLTDKIQKCEITDFAIVKGASSPMTVNVEVTGSTEAIDNQLLNDVIVPNVTGVNTGISYILYGSILFGFDREDNTMPAGSTYGINGWDKGDWLKVTQE